MCMRGRLSAIIGLQLLLSSLADNTQKLDQTRTVLYKNIASHSPIETYKVSKRPSYTVTDRGGL
jgi:hypothetical protein